MSDILSENISWKDFENYLLRKKEEVDEEIKSIERDDPLLLDAVAESSELGSDCWQADVHYKVLAVKDSLGEMSKKIKYSLQKIKEGTYGKCEKCGKDINKERLTAMPVADICQHCFRP